MEAKWLNEKQLSGVHRTRDSNLEKLEAREKGLPYSKVGRAVDIRRLTFRNTWKPGRSNWTSCDPI